MNPFNVKRVADPVHGTIGLSELEVQVISTPVFQRLRNVKQLGLAHYVFPGADYSRFSHSLGVCHVTGRIMSTLQDLLGNERITSDEIQLYRLAALLHDVGHYPFSHAMEHAIEHYFKSRLYEATAVPHSAATERSDVPDAPVAPEAAYYNHESLGKQILQNDPDLQRILDEASFTQNPLIDPTSICAIFLRERPPMFANLVSSDLDADRIDYLLRTAHHTGLPYGTVDLDYLLSQMRVDDHKRVCLTEKALHTADHFLLSRYFDYQQVAFHKTVAALELVLKDVLAALLDADVVDCSASAVSATISAGKWYTFDDGYLFEQIRGLNRSTDDEVIKSKTRSVLERRPPKLVVEKERIQQRSDRSSWLGEVQSVKKAVGEWAEHFSIQRPLWYVWENAVTLTKIGSRIPYSAVETSSPEERDKYDQAVRILGTGQESSEPIFDLPHSLMSVLSEYELRSLRVYVLFPDGRENERLTIERHIRTELPYIGWK